MTPPPPASPRVSVIVPVWNRSVLVRQALDSALAQECGGGFEVIVVNDGSTDDTAAVLAAYGDRIRVVTQENAGPAVARNRGFAAARGELLALLDSDDIWLPGKLAAQLAVLDRHPRACLVHSDVNEFFEGTKAQGGQWSRRPDVLGGAVLRALLRRNFVHTMTVVLRRSALVALAEPQGFDARYPPCEDWDLWLRLAEQYEFAADPVPRVRTRIHAGGISSDPIVVYTKGCAALAAAADRLSAQSHHDAPLARREAARWHVKLGRRLARAGRSAEANAAFAAAVALSKSARLGVVLARMFPKR